MATTHELLCEFVVLALARHLGPGVAAPAEIVFRRHASTSAFDEIVLLRSTAPAYCIRALSFGRDALCVTVESARPLLPDGAQRSSSAAFAIRDDPVRSEWLDPCRAVIRAATIGGPQLLVPDASLLCPFLRPDRLAVVEAKIESNLARALRGPLDGRLAPCLFGLPDELVEDVLTFAGPAATLALDATCREAARHANNARLWRSWLLSHSTPRSVLAASSESSAREAEAIAEAVRLRLPREIDEAMSASKKSEGRARALKVATLLLRPTACEERLRAKLRTEAARPKRASTA